MNHHSLILVRKSIYLFSVAPWKIYYHYYHKNNLKYNLIVFKFEFLY
jgi:hypothetical protein